MVLMSSKRLTGFEKGRNLRKFQKREDGEFVITPSSYINASQTQSIHLIIKTEQLDKIRIKSQILYNHIITN